MDGCYWWKWYWWPNNRNYLSCFLILKENKMLTVESITNPVYGNAEETSIICQVKFAEFDEVHPFGATAWDTEPHGIEIYNNLKAGNYGAIGAYVAPPTPVQPSTKGTTTA